MGFGNVWDWVIFIYQTYMCRSVWEVRLYMVLLKFVEPMLLNTDDVHVVKLTVDIDMVACNILYIERCKLYL